MSDEHHDKKPKITKTGVAVGVGSAALVAALLYASRRGKGKPKARFDDE